MIKYIAHKKNKNDITVAKGQSERYVIAHLFLQNDVVFVYFAFIFLELETKVNVIALMRCLHI